MADEELDRLISYFGRGYRYDPPRSTSEKRDLLRSLMNVRAPGPVDRDIVSVQDGYLSRRAVERGVVDSSRLPTVDEGLGSDVPGAESIAVWQGDITLLRIGAIVNAANAGMLGCFVPMHACIDNCIHTYAGVQLRNECDRRMREYWEKTGNRGWPTAVPMVTPAFNLPADNVVHVVGPIVEDRLTERNEEDLALCYSRTLDACASEGIRSVAFCCISTGVFRFPNRRAAEIAVGTVTEWLSAHPGSLDLVVFNVFKDDDLAIYRELLS